MVNLYTRIGLRRRAVLLALLMEPRWPLQESRGAARRLPPPRPAAGRGPARDVRADGPRRPPVLRGARGGDAGPAALAECRVRPCQGGAGGTRRDESEEEDEDEELEEEDEDEELEEEDERPGAESADGRANR